ncbi:MAG: pyrroline-5-carboxylate reductase [Hyphomicrobiales bacterium]|nr:pyrroline-5-carboxylate reductase [Hyphomicrobiales bacterium]
MDLGKLSVILVGGGNMGSALAGGWLKNGMPASQVKVVDPAPSPQMVRFLSENVIRHVVSAENIAPPDVLLVAVKPQVMGEVLQSIKHLVGEHTVVISVAAGTTLFFMEGVLGQCAIVRAMPNTPALVQRGITVACANSKVSELQVEQANLLLGSTGSIEWLTDENLMDAVTAVSGSGPAYVFYLTEALSNAAIATGLPEALAHKLALETVAGAGEMMMQSDQPPAKLRENVTSPGGTTQAALAVLMDKDGFPALLKRAVDAAVKRGKELS